jgi:hypothetical protein
LHCRTKNTLRVISLAVLSIYSSPPEAQRNCDTCHQGLPPEQSRPSSTYRAEVENGSDNYAVILPEIAVLLGDLNQIRMCCIPI